MTQTNIEWDFEPTKNTTVAPQPENWGVRYDNDVPGKTSFWATEKGTSPTPGHYYFGRLSEGVVRWTEAEAEEQAALISAYWKVRGGRNNFRAEQLPDDSDEDS